MNVVKRLSEDSATPCRVGREILEEETSIGSTLSVGVMLITCSSAIVSSYLLVISDNEQSDER